LIVEKQKNYINGSNALMPELKKDTQKKDKYKKLQREKREREIRISKEKNQKKKSAIRYILILFALGILLTSRYAIIFNIQKDLSSVKNQIQKVDSENEALKIDILKVSSYESVKNTAEKQLNMKEPDNSKALIVDLSKNNFKESNKDKEKLSKFEKLKDILF